MKWLKIIRRLFTRKTKMAQITLDDFDNSKFTFESSELIFIGFDQASQTIVVCLKGKEPKYLPSTPDNLNYLFQILPHFMLSFKELHNQLKPKPPRDNKNKID